MADKPIRNRLVAGCMTGTSLDGLDAALVHISGTGLDMRVEFLAAVSVSLDPVATRLRAIAEQKPHSAEALVQIARDFSDLHVTALRKLCTRRKPDLVSVHGQTVFHRPPLSWQLFNPAPVAHALQVPLVFDLRAMDLAAGGQGAPITPVADWLYYRSADENRAVVNLGGFCNVTVLPPGADAKSIAGADICPCNHLLDGIARTMLNRPYDVDGRIAATGKVSEPMLASLLRLFAGQGNRSLGTGDELSAWIAQQTGQPSADVARSACAAIAQCIADKTTGTEHLILAGGGCLNWTLAQELKERSKALITRSDDHGLPAQYREAAGMAVLGALCQDRVPITSTRTTGVATAPVSGTWIFP
jgi:1,6-anhydro-N-acetylmuramate kinase